MRDIVPPDVPPAVKARLPEEQEVAIAAAEKSLLRQPLVSAFRRCS